MCQRQRKCYEPFIDADIDSGMHDGLILLFYNSVHHQRLTLARPKFALHYGKMLTNTCREIRNYTRARFKWPTNVDETLSN